MSLRACLAAEAWRKLYPNGDGLNKGGRGKKNGEKPRSESDLSFVDFAKSNFKTTRDPAKQALAILNNAPKFFEAANLLPAF